MPMSALLLWIAQGFGAGRFPVAPGTVGSLAGLVWLVLLTATGSLWAFLTGALAGLALSVWLCGWAERALGSKDPASVVFDELVAVPFCFLPWLVSDWMSGGAWPEPERFFAGRAWIPTLLLFALFRCFDILKPWPIHRSQRLPGGWGITADDLLAAGYVALISLVFVA
jgi:phosphatidylglycerophosphatase A